MNLNYRILADLPIYVISLKRATERRQQIKERLDGLGLKFELIDATDERQGLSDAELSLLGLSSQSDYKPSLTPGALGCLISHLRCYQKLLSSSSEYALILEDDAELGQDFIRILDSILSMRPERGFLKHWSIINLGGWLGGEARPFIGQDTYPLNFIARRLLAPAITPPVDIEEHPKYYIGPVMAGLYGTHCYLISRQGCQFSLDRYPRLRGPIDWLMNDSGIPHRLAIAPMVAFQVPGIGDVRYDQPIERQTDATVDATLEKTCDVAENLSAVNEGIKKDSPDVIRTLPINFKKLPHWLQRLVITMLVLIIRKPMNYYIRVYLKR
ncbi:MAG: glycosyltransferase family 25 protein [Gammaproteobacteria bacterium]|nr:glycosyltransferase family 25 protein [Gammaproteobacteria bacterium]